MGVSSCIRQILILIRQNKRCWRGGMCAAMCLNCSRDYLEKSLLGCNTLMCPEQLGLRSDQIVTSCNSDVIQLSLKNNLEEQQGLCYSSFTEGNTVVLKKKSNFFFNFLVLGLILPIFLENQHVQMPQKLQRINSESI